MVLPAGRGAHTSTSTVSECGRSFSRRAVFCGKVNMRPLCKCATHTHLAFAFLKHPVSPPALLQEGHPPSSGVRRIASCVYLNMLFVLLPGTVLTHPPALIPKNPVRNQRKCCNYGSSCQDLNTQRRNKECSNSDCNFY